VLAERRCEPVPLEVRRAQLQDQVAQFLECLLRELAQASELGARRVQVGVEERVRGLGSERDPEELLADRVV
jgi:hypothetical protein